MRAASVHWFVAALAVVASCDAAPPPLAPNDAAALDDVARDVTSPTEEDATPDAHTAPADTAVPLVPPGLALRAVGDITRAGHAREIAVSGDLVFLADANGLPVLRSAPGGALTVVNPLRPKRAQHCSTVSMHARSRTLVCAAADSGYLDFIDVSDPAAPRSRPWEINEHDVQVPGEPIADPIYSLPDVEVSGDVLWMAAQHNGLLRAELGADGVPAGFTRTGVGRSVVGVVAGGGQLALIDRVMGLVMLAEADLTMHGAARLDGPPLDVAMEGARVAVALGGEGAQLFRLDAGTPVPLAHVQPRCVATGVALAGEQLAVACLTGVTLYDLSSAPPRVAGFFPARYGMLDVAFGPHGLLASDWFALDQFATNPAGVADVPEAPIAQRLRPDADARIPVRNPGDAPLAVRWRLTRTSRGPLWERPALREGTLALPPRGEAALELTAAQLAAAASGEAEAEVGFFRDGAAQDAGTAVAYTRVAHRAASDDPSRGLVAIGDRFPSLRRTANSTAPDVMPPPGEALVMFLTVDCYLQWPQLEDMAWARARGVPLPSPAVFFLTTFDEDPFDPSTFMRTHAAADLLTVEWADYSRGVPGQEAEANPVRAFEQSFMMRLPGADFPHDYVLGADGTVLDTARMYRGRWQPRP